MTRHAIFTAILLAAPRVALACPVCFGASDSPLAKATNAGIIAMLGVVAVMLASFASFFIYLNRRARLFSDAGPRPAEIGRSRLSSTNPQEGIAQC
jgi:hypothetical protein